LSYIPAVMPEETSTIRLALAQVNLTVGDIPGNTRKILAWIRRAEKAGADIVAFPELAVAGYPAEDLLLKKRFIEDCRIAVEKIASRVKRPAVIVGYPSLDGSPHNSVAVIHGGGIAAVCDKIELPNYGVFDEKRYFIPGERTCVLAVNGVRIGLSVCEDIWGDRVTAAQVSRGRAQAILNVSCSPYHVGKGMEREALMRDRAAANNVYVAYLNLVGGQDELVFDGHSVVVDPAGKVIARGRQFAEDLIVVDLDPRLLRKRSSRSGPVYHAAPAALPVRTVKLDIRCLLRRTAVTAGVISPMELLEEIYSAILTGTADYVRKNGFKKVVIGLSGGIDSALVATAAVDALGKDSVIGVSMPSRYSSRASITDTRELAGNLDIKLLEIGIDSIFTSYLKVLKKVFAGLPEDVTEENIQARVRGNILMALSNKFGWLVLATGNKSELAAGYCTLYGDLAGGFAILKDVPKTLVYELATYRNLKRRQVIPEAILTKAPSAELRPDQKDEDTLPPYALLDPVLNLYVVEDMGVRDIVNQGYSQQLVKRVAAMVDGNEYKRRQGPPGIKITPRAFGKDRRMPITNLYR
jgi:NAD+ synthase (glutamine-hydrolysing)